MIYLLLFPTECDLLTAYGFMSLTERDGVAVV